MSDVAAAMPKARRAIRKVSVLPPARPEFEAAAPVLETVEASAAERLPSPEVFAKVPSLAAFPPLRSSFQVEASAAAPSVEPVQPAPAVAAVEPIVAERPRTEVRAVVPPPRPDFAEVPASTVMITAVLPPERPAFSADESLAAAPPVVEPPPPPQTRSLFGAIFGRPAQPTAPAAVPTIRTGHDFLDERIAYHAVLNDVPATLVHRVVVRESKYNPRAVGRGGALGLMQIKHATARGLGYGGPATGLLDAETNLTYAVKYLAGAYRLADGDHDRAVQHYARGYYYEAKRRNARVALKGRNERPQRQADAASALDASADGQPAPRSLFIDAR